MDWNYLKNDILDVWSFSHITRFEREYSQKCINQTFSKDLSYYYLIYCFLLFYRILFDPGTAWSSFEAGKCFSCSSWISKTSDVSRKLIKKSIYTFTYFSKHTWKNSVKMAWQKKTLVSFWHAIPSKSYPLRIFCKKIALWRPLCRLSIIAESMSRATNIVRRTLLINKDNKGEIRKNVTHVRSHLNCFI